MNKYEVKIKESPLLQIFIHSGSEMDKLRDSLIKCICEYHKIRDYEKYLNSEAKFNYIYEPWEAEDQLHTTLYSRKEYKDEVSEMIFDIELKSNKFAHMPKLESIIYTKELEILTPVGVIQKYMESHYLISDGIYPSIIKRY